jgi:hypothetical protein
LKKLYYTRFVTVYLYIIFPIYFRRYKHLGLQQIDKKQSTSQRTVWYSYSTEIRQTMFIIGMFLGVTILPLIVLQMFILAGRNSYL